MSVAAKDAFREFWEATYAGMKKPRKGWPEEVKVCLRAVYEQEPGRVRATLVSAAGIGRRS
jgi:hypothetical protein